MNAVQPSYKVCAHCGQRAVPSMPACGRCGSPFPSAVYNPAPRVSTASRAPLAAIASVLVLLLVLVGCAWMLSSRPAAVPAYIGAWRADNGDSLVLRPNGTGMMGFHAILTPDTGKSGPLRYSVENGTISLTFPDGPIPPLALTVSSDNNTLTMTGFLPMVYHRVH